MKTKVAGLTFDSKQDALDFFRSGLKTLEGKGKQPTTAGLFDKSAPERRRDAQVMVDLAIREFAKTALEEGQTPDAVRKTIDELAYDSIYFAQT